jgi:hypothetical protein
MSVSRPRCRALAAVTVTAASLVLATPGTARADRGHRHHGKLAVLQVNLICRPWARLWSILTSSTRGVWR